MTDATEGIAELHKIVDQCADRSGHVPLLTPLATLRAILAHIDAQAAEIGRLTSSGVGYSQQTVDALSSERDRLRAALTAAMEVVQRERTRIAYNAKRAPPAVEIGYADIMRRLDAVIAQADAALGSDHD